MSKFELSTLALKSAYKDNIIITDDKGLPSVMVYIPKFKMSDVIDGRSDRTHPAFIVDGVEKDGIYISKYLNVVYEGRAYSLPAEDPDCKVSFDTASSYCSAKGNGWHLMTAMEWGAIALWCRKNGCTPLGNNNNGKDIGESTYKAIATAYTDEGDISRVATGTGPLEWSHNKQLDGIYDLNGNLEECIGGLRLVYGELQILENNNAANSANSQAVESAHWKAIDGLTGALIEPNGLGTTENSIRLDCLDAWYWKIGEVSIRAKKSGVFSQIRYQVNDEAEELLHALALLPYDSDDSYQSDKFYASNIEEEIIMHRGGHYLDTTNAGIFSSALVHLRSTVAEFGFRSAYYE